MTIRLSTNEKNKIKFISIDILRRSLKYYVKLYGFQSLRIHVHDEFIDENQIVYELNLITDYQEKWFEIYLPFNSGVERDYKLLGRNGKLLGLEICKYIQKHLID